MIIHLDKRETELCLFALCYRIKHFQSVLDDKNSQCWERNDAKSFLALYENLHDKLLKESEEVK